MKLQNDPPREPEENTRTRICSISPLLPALSDWLDTEPDERAATGGDCFGPEAQERAKARDLADRAALAGRDCFAREPEEFELFGRTLMHWHAEAKAPGAGLRAWLDNAPEQKRRAGVRLADLPGSPPCIEQAYAVLVVRLDRTGRKLGKFLVPRFPSNGPIPSDEGAVRAWLFIPSVEFWGTRCDWAPAAQTLTAGAWATTNGGER